MSRPEPDPVSPSAPRADSGGDGAGASPAHGTRLDRLEAWLAADPDNEPLLAAAFDAALATAAWDRAERHLRHAQRPGTDAPAWRHREAHWLMAQHRWGEARRVLEEIARLAPDDDAHLRGDDEPATGAVPAHHVASRDQRARDAASALDRPGHHVVQGERGVTDATLARDLAWIDLRAGDAASAVDRLACRVAHGETGVADRVRAPHLASIDPRAGDAAPLVDHPAIGLLHREHHVTDALPARDPASIDQRAGDTASPLDGLPRHVMQREHGVTAATLAHDLAWIDLRAGDAASAVDRLAPHVVPGAADPGSACARLWLRALHLAGELDRALAWMRTRERGGGLDPACAGIASLVALDAGAYIDALRWADAALAGASPDAPPPVEALVARGSLALAERDATGALRLLRAAAALHPDDGRTGSALGCAELLAGRLPAARAAFERATAALPRHVGTWHGLGWTALAEGDLAAAARAFDAALALDRNLADSHGGRAVVHACAGEADAARAAVARARGLDPASIAAGYAAARLDGQATDGAAIRRLAERLLRNRRGPFGGSLHGVVLGGESGTRIDA